jgi:hypothetical protein
MLVQTTLVIDKKTEFVLTLSSKEYNSKPKSVCLDKLKIFPTKDW